MNLKRNFGAVLTILGIAGLIYVGNGLISKGVGNTSLIVVGIIALLFFFSGISLVKNTKDKARFWKVPVYPSPRLAL